MLRPDGLEPGSVLGRLPLFCQLPPTQLDLVAAATGRIELQRGEILFHAGDPGTNIFAVMQGQITLSVGTAEGTEKVLEIICAGETFAEAVVFAGRSYPVTAQAVMPTVLLSIPGQAVLDLLDRDRLFARRMLAGMAVRLHTMVSDVTAVTLHSAGQRVASYLLGLAGAQPHDGTVVRLPATKAVVASRLSLTPETLSRTFRELTERGLIQVQGREVTLLDLGHLTTTS